MRKADEVVKKVNAKTIAQRINQDRREFVYNHNQDNNDYEAEILYEILDRYWSLTLDPQNESLNTLPANVISGNSVADIYIKPKIEEDPYTTLQLFIVGQLEKFKTKYGDNKFEKFVYLIDNKIIKQLLYLPLPYELKRVILEVQAQLKA